MDPASNKERTGFEIGWDYGFYNLRPPDGTSQTVLDGYCASRDHFNGKYVRHDRFIRKWLLLRLNAWKRDRIIDPDITPTFIQSIDAAYCPITREPLTHGTQEDSDWSVDRLNNDGGYSRFNLVVMSVRANQAKGNLSIDGVRTLVEEALQSETGKIDGLHWRHWLRMLVVMNYVRIRQDSQNLDDALVLPMAVVPPPGVPVCEWFSLLQVLMYEQLGAAAEGRRHRAIDILPGKRLRGMYDRVYGILATLFSRKILIQRKAGLTGRVASQFAFEDAWMDPFLMKEYCRLVRAVAASSDFGKFVSRLNESRRGGKRITRDKYVKRLHLDTKGYID